jgi:RecJ-like exonuclease
MCVSHKEDADGICSAAIVKSALQASKVVLVDYANLMARLEKAVSAGKHDRIVVCDLGLSKKNEKQFAEVLTGCVSDGKQVFYIDHHDLNKETSSSLRKGGVNLVHTVDECTSVQAYGLFKNELPANAAFLAAMGALTDYMEDRPTAARLVQKFDRQFLMLEATSLSYMISANQHHDEFLVKLVDTLSKMKFPHDVRDGFEIAERYAKKVAHAVETIRDQIVPLENLAYAPSTVELSASMVVNFVLGASEKPAAMVYKLKDDINSYVFSIRGASNCKVHLGRLVNEIATGLGGSGGGHDRACGAVVPKDKLEEFVRAIYSKIDSN